MSRILGIALALVLAGGCAPVQKGGGGFTPVSSGPAPTVQVSNDPIPPAFTGIFSLQALFDFDTLEGAFIDPESGAISLFGRRTHPDQRLQIAFLDHLATALECTDPVFTLDVDSTSQALVDRALEMDVNLKMDRLANLFDSSGRLTSMGAWWFRLGGCKVHVGMTKISANAQMMFATGRTRAGKALQIMEKMEGIDTNGPRFEELFTQLCEAIEVREAIAEKAAEFRAGRLTQTQLSDFAYPAIIRGLAEAFGEDPQPFLNDYWTRRRRGQSTEAAYGPAIMGIQDPVVQKRFLGRALDDMLGGHKNLHVSPAEAAVVLGAVPRVRPVFRDLPPRSLMARVAFEADVLGKFLMDMPELQKKIPRYRTWFEWEQTVGRTGNMEGHFWFSPDGFELHETADGNGVRFGTTRVRINLERYVAGRQSRPHPALQQYADELTLLFDDLAREYSILHELRECMKVVALAKWIKSRGFQLSFPREGRVLWNPPGEIPGIIHINIAKQNQQYGSTIRVLGGVDLRQQTLRFVKSPDQSLPVVELFRKDDSKLRAILRKKIDVPNPMDYDANRDLPGWVKRAELGGEMRSYVTARRSQLATRADAAEVLRRLDEVDKLARIVDGYDRQLNAMRKEGIERQRELETLTKEGEEARRQYLSDTKDALVDSAALLHELRTQRRVVGTPDVQAQRAVDQFNSLAADLKEGIEDAQTIVDGALKGDLDAAGKERMVERLTRMVATSEQMLEAIGRLPTETGQQVATRVLARVNATWTIGKLSTQIGTAVLQGRLSDTLSSAAGGTLQQQEEILKRRNAIADEFAKKRKQIDDLLK